MAWLISFSGLPGVGKSTVAQALARETSALYLRVDSIETALKTSTLNIYPADDAGYLAAIAVAKDNLKLGLNVIGDTVNPIELTRRWWSDAAVTSGSRMLNVEVVCTDQTEHRRRVEARRNAAVDCGLPDWKRVQNRRFEDWTEDRVVLDTSKLSVDECVVIIICAVGN